MTARARIVDPHVREFWRAWREETDTARIREALQRWADAGLDYEIEVVRVLRTETRIIADVKAQICGETVGMCWRFDLAETV